MHLCLVLQITSQKKKNYIGIVLGWFFVWFILCVCVGRVKGLLARLCNVFLQRGWPSRNHWLKSLCWLHSNQIWLDKHIKNWKINLVVHLGGCRFSAPQQQQAWKLHWHGHCTSASDALHCSGFLFGPWQIPIHITGYAMGVKISPLVQRTGVVVLVWGFLVLFCFFSYGSF